MQKATSTIHNCHYASITLDGENRQVCDFVPKTGNRVILCAGFNGWGFKYGSLIGSEVQDLFAGGVPPAGLEWNPRDRESFIMGALHRLIHKLAHGTIED